MSELRQDLVSGDWIIMAPERARRPNASLPKRKKRRPTPKSECPFENLEKSGNWPPILSFPNDKNWKAVIIPNKYPALRHTGKTCATTLRHGPYRFFTGVGYHELVITRDHAKNIAHQSSEEGVQVFKLIQARYRMLEADSCPGYVSTFFNWGREAGASLYHPHYQMLALPIVPPDIEHSLRGSRRYFRKHRRCVHCDMVRYERKSRKRIVEENKLAIAVAPFVSREPFEIRIYPKRHFPCFEKTPLPDLKAVVAVLRSSLRRIERYLRDPDLNFFIHTAPLKKQHQYRHYHWHIEVLPKISISAGFELSTGVEINVVDPDRAAAILRGGKTQ